MCSVVKSDSAERTCIKRDYYTSIVCQFLERVIYTTTGPADQDSDLNQIFFSHLIFGLRKRNLHILDIRFKRKQLKVWITQEKEYYKIKHNWIKI